MNYHGCLWPYIQFIVMSAGAFIGFFVGGFDSFLRVLLAFVILDYFTALALAAKEKRFSSDIGFWGICKKILIFAVVALAHLIESEIINTGDMLRSAVVFFYLANEGLSVIENCAALGLLIPERMRVVFLKIRNTKLERDVNDENKVWKQAMEGSIYWQKAYDDLKTKYEQPVNLTDPMLEQLTNGRGFDEL